MNKKTLLVLSHVISASVFGSDGVPSLVDSSFANFNDGEHINRPVSLNRTYTEGFVLSTQDENRLTMQIARLNPLGLVFSTQDEGGLTMLIARFNALNTAIENFSPNRENQIPNTLLNLTQGIATLNQDTCRAFRSFIQAQDLTIIRQHVGTNDISDDFRNFLRDYANMHTAAQQ